MARSASLASLASGILLLATTCIVGVSAALTRRNPCTVTSPSRSSSLQAYSLSESVQVIVNQYDNDPWDTETNTGPYLLVSIYLDDYESGFARGPAQCLSVTGNSVSTSASCTVPGTYNGAPATFTITASGKGPLTYSSIGTYKNTDFTTSPPTTLSTYTSKYESYTCSTSCLFTVTVRSADNPDNVLASFRLTQFYFNSGFAPRNRWCY